MWKEVIALSMVVFLVFSSSVNAQIAFPGAEGAGKYATGGRGANVYEVTTLADYRPYSTDTPIPGSLRYGVMREDFPISPPTARNVPRIIVFRVSGTIELVKPLPIEYGNLTIAGQTAPGDGITLKNCTLQISNTVYAKNIIIRYIRVRMGEGPFTANGRANQGQPDTVTVDAAENLILDHVSSSWSIDETMSFAQTGGPYNNKITFQWCLIGEGLDRSIHTKGPHSKSTLLYGSLGHKFSFHHNIYAHEGDRNPRVTGFSNYAVDPNGIYWDFRNNVVYNWGGGYAGHCPSANTVTHLNIVNNYYKRGVDTSPTSVPWEERSLHSQGYVNGNWLDGVNPSDPWSVVRFVGLNDANIAAYKQSSEIPVEPMPTDDTLTAYNKVLADAGCSVPYRDAVDRRIVSDIENGTGQIIDCTEPNDYNSYIATAQAGTSNTLTMVSNEQHVNRDSGGGALVGYDITILSGTGAGQTRNITAHDATTKIVTVTPDWTTIPDSTSRYAILIHCDKHAYGWPVLRNGTPPPDSDHDGMPDKWETARGLNPNSASDGNAVAASGYTNVEDYLNYLAVRKTVLPADLNCDGQVDNDDLAFFTGEWLASDSNNIPYSDMDNNYNVNFSDYATFAEDWLAIY